MVKKKKRKLTRWNAWLDFIEAEHPELYRVTRAEYLDSINRQIEAQKKTRREAGSVQGGMQKPI
jgi:hypothetical protein